MAATSPAPYDYNNGGHWFFTEFASASTEASGGPFTGCFNAVANTCFEAIAVTQGNSPYGPYNVYYLNANYNPAEPGAPFLLNDFTKIGLTRDAFLLFYDEFPLSRPGIGGGGFNGAQQYAFDKNAMEQGAPVTLRGGAPNPRFSVAIENMGTLATPDGTCASDNTSTAPASPAGSPSSRPTRRTRASSTTAHGGSGFMLDSLDFYGNGDTRIAAFDWTGLSSLNGTGDGVRFGGQLFSGTGFYEDFGLIAPQKAGPIPLGDECGAAGWSVPPSPGGTAPASCPEGGIETNGDNFTQVSQAQGELWGTAVDRGHPVLPERERGTPGRRCTSWSAPAPSTGSACSACPARRTSPRPTRTCRCRSWLAPMTAARSSRSPSPAMAAPPAPTAAATSRAPPSPG